MKTWISNLQAVENLWVTIKNFTQEEKIWLISKLSESLLDRHQEVNEKIMKEKEYTDEFLRRFAGSWNSNLSAEEIINKIGEHKSCKDPISF